MFLQDANKHDFKSHLCECECFFIKVVRAIQAKLLAQSLACGKYLRKFSFCLIIIIFMVFINYCYKFMFFILQPLVVGILQYPYLDLIRRNKLMRQIIHLWMSNIQYTIFDTQVNSF